MNTVDIIILVALVPFLIQGIKKGFVSQLTALVSLILGIWLAIKFSPLVVGYIQPYLELTDAVLKVIAFVLVLVVVVLLLNLVGKLLEKFLKMVMLGWLDKLLGLVLALLKGAILVGLLIVLFNTLNTNFDLVPEDVLNESVLYPIFKDAVYTVIPYFKDMLFNGGGTEVINEVNEGLGTMLPTT